MDRQWGLSVLQSCPVGRLEIDMSTGVDIKGHIRWGRAQVGTMGYGCNFLLLIFLAAAPQ